MPLHAPTLEQLSFLATIGTALLALLIYFEAKHLRKIDGLARSIGNWQDFDKFMLDKELSERWHSIHSGKVNWNDITQRDKALIYSYLNIMVYEFTAARADLLDKLYAEKSVGDNILYFQYIWDGLLSHLRTDGCPTEFVDAADKVVKAAVSKNSIKDQQVSSRI